MSNGVTTSLPRARLSKSGPNPLTKTRPRKLAPETPHVEHPQLRPGPHPTKHLSPNNLLPTTSPHCCLSRPSPRPQFPSKTNKPRTWRGNPMLTVRSEFPTAGRNSSHRLMCARQPRHRREVNALATWISADRPVARSRMVGDIPLFTPSLSHHR